MCLDELYDVEPIERGGTYFRRAGWDGFSVHVFPRHYRGFSVALFGVAATLYCTPLKLVCPEDPQVVQPQSLVVSCLRCKRQVRLLLDHAVRMPLYLNPLYCTLSSRTHAGSCIAIRSASREMHGWKSPTSVQWSAAAAARRPRSPGAAANKAA